MQPTHPAFPAGLSDLLHLHLYSAIPSLFISAFGYTLLGDSFFFFLGVLHSFTVSSIMTSYLADFDTTRSVRIILFLNFCATTTLCSLIVFLAPGDHYAIAVPCVAFIGLCGVPFLGSAAEQEQTA